MTRFQDASDTSVEVIVVEVNWNLLIVFKNDNKVAVNEIQTLHNGVSLVEASLGKDQHHKGVEQLLVFNHFHVTFCHLGTEV